MTTEEEKRENLARLSAAYGVLTSYFDIWGQSHEVPLETLETLLEATGVDVNSPQEAFKHYENLSWTQLAQPVLVASIETLPAELFFQMPVSRRLEEIKWRFLRVRLEIFGENSPSVIHSFNTEELTFIEERELNGSYYERWSFPFPMGLSIGYYQFKLLVEYDQEKLEQQFLVILCPEKAYLPSALQGDGKKAGIAISLYGLRSRANWGIGDLGDLKDFIRWAVGNVHLDVIGLNPLHAITNRQPYNISPYFPSSRFYRNFIYLDIERMEDYRSCIAAEQFVREETSQNLLAEFRHSRLVQYERVAAFKFKVLKMVFQSFLENHRGEDGLSDRGRQFEAYIDREGSLLDNFAVFCALEDFFHQAHPEFSTWRQWPQPYRNPYSREVREFRQNHQESILFYKYLQWQLDEQLHEAQDLAKSLGASIGLYHDLALGIDPGGADYWAYQDFFVEGVTVGAPPDDFALEGQNWGFHPPHGENYRRDGYRLFSKEISRNCQGGGALRIDHVMRFFRLFWIIAGQPAKEGTYVEYDYQNLLKILALQSERSKTLIIGEDLGTVPPQAREALARFGIFSYRLFYFERDEHGGFKDGGSYPQLALASLGTHDLPTLAGYWVGEDLHLRKSLGLFPRESQFEAAWQNRKQEKHKIVERLVNAGFLSEHLTGNPEIYNELTEDLHGAIIAFILSTSAKLVLLSQEDLFGDARQQNVPGTVSEYPNWSTKMSYSLEELRQNPEVEKNVRVFRHWLSNTGRSVDISS
ncbi:MAG: 4-alpha-glucanotransferase [Deltaproteobacteria bacterium]|jgi:4-alpha-glucanotransferase